MMSTRRTLLACGLLSMVLAVPMASPATAQIIDTLPAVTGPGVAPDVDSATATSPTTGTKYNRMTLTWSLDNNAASLSLVDGDMDLGFKIYYVKGRKAAEVPTAAEIATAQALLDSPVEYGAAMAAGMVMDVGKPTMRSASTAGGTTFMDTMGGLDQNSLYAFAIVPYNDPLRTDIPGSTSIERATANAAAATAMAPMPTRVRTVELMSGDEMLTVSWERPTNTGGSSLTIAGYKVRWRTGQTSTDAAGDMITYPPAGSTTMLTATMYEIPDLINGVAYEVQVQAINSAKAVGPWYPTDWMRGTPSEDGEGPTSTPALPLFGVLALFGGLLAAGRARLRR
jgi:hypothetical protein